MHITLAHVGSRSRGKDDFNRLTESYLERCTAFVRWRTEAFSTEKTMLEWLDHQRGRTGLTLVLFDLRGRQLSSDSFAEWLGKRRDEGAQHIVFAIGPASGWSDEARSRAVLLLSLGSLTLPHALARLVVAEQVYRAFTILSGHPYHCGH